MQTTEIFENVSQGVRSKKKDLEKAFPGLSQEDICRHILKTGKGGVSLFSWTLFHTLPPHLHHGSMNYSPIYARTPQIPQVSEKERTVGQDSLYKEIFTIVASRCLNRATGLPLTTSMAETAIKDVKFVIKPKENAKKQALKAIEAICSGLPDMVCKANMRLRKCWASYGLIVWGCEDARPRHRRKTAYRILGA